MKWLDEATCVVCIGKMFKTVTHADVLRECPFKALPYEVFAINRKGKKVQEAPIEQLSIPSPSPPNPIPKSVLESTSLITNYVLVAAVTAAVTFGITYWIKR